MLSFMSDLISIISATRDAEDGLIVTFSDGTITGYVAEELIESRPHRESVCSSPTADIFSGVSFVL
jgi:hypothetical protein